MRFVELRGVALAAGLGLAGGTEALAAPPQLFPVQPHLVPVVVAAAFILPAAMAGFLSVMRRLGRAGGAVLGAGLLVVALAAVAAYVQPDLLLALRG